MSDRPKLSIVVPLYNEEACVGPLSASLAAACDPLRVPYELIFVDDGSRDGTFPLLRALHDRDPRVKVIRFRKNYGQTSAMAAGFASARGETIVGMDGDLQNDPTDIPRLLARLDEGFDLVCGWRRTRKDTFWTRRLPSVIANWLIGRVTGVRIHDNGCSLKAYRGGTIKKVSLYGEMHRFIPAMATLAGARIAELVVNHHPRRYGKSKYGIGRIWRVALDIITIKMITSFASRPALWFGLLGFPCFVLGTSVLAAAAALYLGRFPDEWIVTATVAFLLLSLGAHLLTMGILGELAMKTGDYRPQQTLAPTILGQ